jgi:hypothetical protein
MYLAVGVVLLIMDRVRTKRRIDHDGVMAAIGHARQRQF